MYWGVLRARRPRHEGLTCSCTYTPCARLLSRGFLLHVSGRSARIVVLGGPARGASEAVEEGRRTSSRAAGTWPAARGESRRRGVCRHGGMTYRAKPMYESNNSMLRFELQLTASRGSVQNQPKASGKKQNCRTNPRNSGISVASIGYTAWNPRTGTKDGAEPRRRWSGLPRPDRCHWTP